MDTLECTVGNGTRATAGLRAPSNLVTLGVSDGTLRWLLNRRMVRVERRYDAKKLTGAHKQKSSAELRTIIVSQLLNLVANLTRT